MTHDSTMRPTRRQAALTLTTLAALSLTACSIGSDGAEFEGDDAQDAPTEPTPEDAGGSDGGGQDPQPEADGQEPDHGEAVDANDAISTVTYTLPTDEVDGTMTLGFHHLRQRGNTMELLLTYTPEFDSAEAFSLWHLHGGNHANVVPALFDRENLKQYSILRTGRSVNDRNGWSSTNNQHELASGDTQAYWANFAAPEDDIETINIAVPGAPEFEDVPIEQGSVAASAGTGTDEDGEE